MGSLLAAAAAVEKSAQVQLMAVQDLAVCVQDVLLEEPGCDEEVAIPACRVR